MFDSETGSWTASPSFNANDLPVTPGPKRLAYREAYYHLVNVEEHPEVLPFAYDVANRRLDSHGVNWANLSAPVKGVANALDRLPGLTRFLAEQGGTLMRRRELSTGDLKRHQSFHYFMQYLPAALVDGCWLQGAPRASTAHTKIGAAITGLYQHQVRALVADTRRHFVAEYQAVQSRLGPRLEGVSSHSFSERLDFAESIFALPIFLLSIGQFTRTFLCEIVGVNLAWQYLDVSALGPHLLRDVIEAYQLPPLDEDLLDPLHFERGRELALAATVRLIEDVDASALEKTWTALLRGVGAGIAALTEWFDAADETAPKGPRDPRQDMIDLVRKKAPHACGYHADKALGARRIDDYLNPDGFDGEALLDALSDSFWVRPGKSDNSPLLKRLIEFGGAMSGVFSPAEQRVIRNWIDSLPAGKTEAGLDRRDAPTRPLAAPGSAPRSMPRLDGRGWNPGELQRRSAFLYGKCSIRELYYHLVNIEFYPDILPVAERYAKDRLAKSMASLWSGERAIPSRRYDPAALDLWLFTKHREQVDSYRPLKDRPKVPREAFIEANVQLAPLILIDGAWLQGTASPTLVHTAVGRMLFHVFIEEVGEGRAEQHHANIYRELLKAMGVIAPPVDSWEFARWSRLQDTAFEIPAFWLSISCFPRHFLPEILGMNLAVELAGVGGPYMEARDTLRQFRYPTLFVDVHNSADNVTAGHSAWAVNAIKRYLDEVAERDGPHNVDHIWHRVWSGVRATLPQIGRARLMAHRIKQRLLGPGAGQAALIFPS